MDFELYNLPELNSSLEKWGWIGFELNTLNYMSNQVSIRLIIS